MGVFAVDRRVFDHPMFASDQPFTDREAWIWMISEAAWKPTRVRVGTAIVSLSRGELSHSIRFLAEKWRWHRAKVERFLNRLKTETMIETRTETGVTVIRLCKYNEYQRVSLPAKTPTETPAETGPRQQRDREEYIEDIEVDIGARNAPTPNKRGTRLSENWTPSPENIQYARSKGIPDSKLTAEADKFRDHWIAKAGKDGVKLDWNAAWRTWVAKACEFRGYAPSNGSATVEVVWKTVDDECWAALDKRYRNEHNGRGPASTGGNGGMGRYWPKAWVEAAIPSGKVA